jgi:hypothetical protein
MSYLMFPQQQARLGNAAKTVCQPIDWGAILSKPAQLTPKTVRIYLVDVVARMSQHFALWMDGPNIGKLQCRRAGKYNQDQYININVSVWCARQLFPKMVSCKWIENGKQKSFRKNVIDLFLMASDRKQIYQTAATATQPLEPVLKWLDEQLSLPEEVCSIKWNGLNDRQLLYSSFLEDKPNPNDWTPKSISQAFYTTLPGCRPATGKRIRKRGVAVMYMPSRQECQQVLDRWKQKHLHLRF